VRRCEGGGRARVSRLFNYLSRSRTPPSFVAREWDGDAISRITGGIANNYRTRWGRDRNNAWASRRRHRHRRSLSARARARGSALDNCGDKRAFLKDEINSCRKVSKQQRRQSNRSPENFAPCRALPLPPSRVARAADDQSAAIVIAVSRHVRRLILASALAPPTNGIRRTKGERVGDGRRGVEGSDRTREEVTRRGRARSGRENVCETPGNSAAGETTRGVARARKRDSRGKREREARGEREDDD